jgi:hypothetical protein
MCNEMLVIPVDWMVDKKIIIQKMEGQGGGEALGVAGPKKNGSTSVCSFTLYSLFMFIIC